MEMKIVEPTIELISELKNRLEQLKEKKHIYEKQIKEYDIEFEEKLGSLLLKIKRQELNKQKQNQDNSKKQTNNQKGTEI